MYNICLANHWKYYPEPACFTVNSVKQSRLNRTESPSPSLLNTVYSEAGWFGVIFPVISQTITPLGCDALQSSAQCIIYIGNISNGNKNVIVVVISKF